LNLGLHPEFRVDVLQHSRHGFFLRNSRWRSVSNDVIYLQTIGINLVIVFNRSSDMDLSFLSKTAAAAILNFQKWQIATLGNDKNGHVNFVAKCRCDILTLFWRQPTAAQRR